MKNRSISLTLCIILVFSLLMPVISFAENIETSGVTIINADSTEEILTETFERGKMTCGL